MKYNLAAFVLSSLVMSSVAFSQPASTQLTPHSHTHCAAPSLQLIFDVTDMNFTNLMNMNRRTHAGSAFDLKKTMLVLNNNLQLDLLHFAIVNKASAPAPQLIIDRENHLALFTMTFATVDARDNCLAQIATRLADETRAPDDDGPQPQILNANPGAGLTSIVALRAGDMSVQQSNGESLELRTMHRTSQNPYAPENRGPRWIVETHASVEFSMDGSDIYSPGYGIYEVETIQAYRVN